MLSDSERLSTPTTALFWAKTGNNHSPTHGLSLVQHMLDAGSVAARLWDTWLAPGLQRRFSEHLHLSMEDTRALVCWLAATHDMGKATPEFTCQYDRQKTTNILVPTANVLDKLSLISLMILQSLTRVGCTPTINTARAFSPTCSPSPTMSRACRVILL